MNRSGATRPLTIKDIPDLPGYMTVAQVAFLFNVSRFTVYDDIYVKRRFKKVFRAGKPEDTGRPMLLLDETEVREQYEQSQQLSPKQAFRAWNLRVKTWANESGWAQRNGLVVSPRGEAQLKMVFAYVDEHPDDPNPKGVKQ